MNNVTAEKIEELTNNILVQAKYFLDEADEFYPFGSIININGLIKPLGIYFGDEFPDATEVLNNLSDSITIGVKKGDYLCGAIGINVYVNVNNLDKRDAVEIRYYQEDSYYSKQYFYYKKNDKYVFET